MNQILDIKIKNKKLIKFFKIQLVFSLMMIVILIIYILNDANVKNNEKNISNVITLNARLSTIFQKDSISNDVYFCKLKIAKINLEYFIYNDYSEELLKILPCKFSGTNFENNGNICIIGHNYFDDRFFGNLNKLKINDEIILENLKGKEYKYMVYDIYEINEQDINEVISNNGVLKTVTLCTCTFDKNKRLIVKAKM